MAWIDLSGANAPINAIGSDLGYDLKGVEGANIADIFVPFNYVVPIQTQVFNPIYRQQIIDESGGGGSTRPSSGFLYPRGQG